MVRDATRNASDGAAADGTPRRLIAGAAGAAGWAAAVTAAIAWPVLASPTRQIFGHEIVGRHHDPFTVMRQMAGSGAAGPYLQPITDGAGWLLARVLDPVAAYNVLILSTFPLTAVATYALARYLWLPHRAALVAALLYTFAPLHVAHAAYHPHIAQTQWLPLYVLALFAMIDRPSVWRGFCLTGACAALVLSNFYAGLIGAVLTPLALVAYWLTSPRAPLLRHLWITAGLLAGLAATGAAAIALVLPQLASNPSAYGFPLSDVPQHSARWWAYFVPSVSHALLGPMAAGVFERAAVTVELLEQQVYVSYALIVLAAGAGAAAIIGWRHAPRLRWTLALWALALAAALVSVGPLNGTCVSDSWTLACRLHAVVPMFRSYARFAFVSHLALALAAGAGVALLSRRGRSGQAMAACLVSIAVFEYWPLPPRGRDVLPTVAHRRLATQASAQQTLDCTAPAAADADVPWLMRRRLSLLGGIVRTCRDPDLGPKLAALGYTHVIVRQPDQAGVFPLLDDPDAGLTLLETFPDARVYEVSATVPAVLTLADRGFHEYEYAGRDVWQWMGPEGTWRVRNTTGGARRVGLVVDLQAAHEARALAITLDGVPAASLLVPATIESHKLGPWSLAAGDHDVAFTPGGAPFRPSDHGLSSDDRALTIAFRAARWVEWTDPDDRSR